VIKHTKTASNSVIVNPMAKSRLLPLVVALSVALCAMFVAEPEAHARSRRSSSGIGLGGAGLLLLGGGILTAAPGLTILYVCREDEPCHSDTSTAVGWALAAPGIPAIALGALFLWLDKPGGSRGSVFVPRTMPVAITGGPIRSGGMIGASYQF
jgi:hypothetical protein